MMGWFADYLSNADEPSLCKLSKKDATANVYRFVFFPPYACVTIFRLEIKPDGSALLELRKVKQLQLQTQMSIVPGRVVRKAEFLVSKRGVNHFLTLLHQMKFWQLPPHVVSKDPILGDDDWLYEAAAFGKYHMVECASSTGPEPILPGEYLMKLIGEWE
jgi:hypothetical protein